MKLQILAFGIARDILDGSEVEVESRGDSTTATKLKELLAATYPALADLPSYLLAVNGAYATGKTRIRVGDEVAIIPPTSGG